MDSSIAFFSQTEAVHKDSLSLALVGDAVWTLYVRTRLIKKHDCKSGLLSLKCVNYVSAKAQCKMLYAIEDKLTEIESDVVRRARNSRTGQRAKNASLEEYKKASALEALIGFLYLTGQAARLEEIQDICFNAD